MLALLVPALQHLELIGDVMVPLFLLGDLVLETLDLLPEYNVDLAVLVQFEALVRQPKILLRQCFKMTSNSTYS